jgi:glycosyltransferase involved in cell wall biosynthesis
MMIKKTIILTSTYYKPHFGGIENSLDFLAQEYQKLGYKVIILCSDAGLNKKDRLVAFEKEDNDIEIHRFKSYFPKIYLDYFLKYAIDVKRVKKKIKQFKKELNVEAIIARSPETVLGSVLSKSKVSYIVPGILKTQNTVNSKDIKSKLINLFIVSQQSFFQKKALEKANRIYVFSKNMNEQIKVFLKNKKIETILINPGVDIEKFNLAKGKVIRNKFKIEKKAFIFLAVGRLIKIKGIHFAISSFASLNNKNSFFIIVGDGPEKNYLQLLAKTLNVADRVIFTGMIRNKVENYFKASNAFIMSSTHETFGQTILEALAAKLPVVGWKSGGEIVTATSEIISNVTNGFLVEFNENNLTEAMGNTINLTSNELYKIEENNFELVTKNYSWKTMALNLLK